MTMGWGEICSDARYNLVVKNGVYYSDGFLRVVWGSQDAPVLAPIHPQAMDRLNVIGQKNRGFYAQ